MLLPILCVIFNVIVRTCLELYFQIVVFTHSYSVYFTLHNIYVYTHKYYINIRETRIKNGQPRDTDNIGHRTCNDGYYTT